MKQLFWLMTSFAAGLLVGGLVVGPLPHPELAQEAILREYLAVYCSPADRNHVERWIGNAEAMSRISISAGLGERALAEYALCKIGVTK